MVIVSRLSRSLLENRRDRLSFLRSVHLFLHPKAKIPRSIPPNYRAYLAGSPKFEIKHMIKTGKHPSPFFFVTNCVGLISSAIPTCLRVMLTHSEGNNIVITVWIWARVNTTGYYVRYCWKYSCFMAKHLWFDKRDKRAWNALPAQLTSGITVFIEIIHHIRF